jgi:hypothetical protein
MQVTDGLGEYEPFGMLGQPRMIPVQAKAFEYIPLLDRNLGVGRSVRRGAMLSPLFVSRPFILVGEKKKEMFR